jgi:hypothetical protein
VNKRLSLVALAALVSLDLSASCGKKSSGPALELTGLAAVPASAEVVIAADVPRIIDSPLVQRAFDMLLARDADLSARWQKLHDSCKLDAGQIKHVILAIGPHQGPQPGTGPVLMVATGKLSETELATCVRDMVGHGGGSVTVKTAAGRTLYEAKDGNRTMFFAFARADTVVLGSNEEFVTEALGPGKKALDNPDLKRWIELADQRAPIWAAGHVDERVRQGLVRVTSGKVSAGPTAIAVSADASAGAKIELVLLMANAQDAKALESFANMQKGLLGYAAQAKQLGGLVDRIAITSDHDLVRFSVALAITDVNELVSALDGKGSAAQDSPPPAGSGTSPGSQAEGSQATGSQAAGP